MNDDRISIRALEQIFNIFKAPPVDPPKPARKITPPLWETKRNLKEARRNLTQAIDKTIMLRAAIDKTTYGEAVTRLAQEEPEFLDTWRAQYSTDLLRVAPSPFWEQSWLDAMERRKMQGMNVQESIEDIRLNNPRLFEKIWGHVDNDNES